MTPLKVVCQMSGIPNHTSLTCQLYMAQPLEVPHEEASYVKDGYRAQNPNPRNDPYSPTYNLGWRNHPNLWYGNNATSSSQPQSPNQAAYQAPYGARDRPPHGYQNNFSGYQAQLPLVSSLAPNKSPELIAMENRMTEMWALSNKGQALEQTQKMTETQVAQNTVNVPRPLGTLSGHSVENPKGKLSAVTLRDGKEFNQRRWNP